MKLLFLGSGSAFTVGDENFHSNMVLMDDQSHHFMIDCGSDARLSLHAQGMTYRDITDVYISHLHADHAGGLEWLAFSSKFDPRTTVKPRLYTSDKLIRMLWNNVLSGGLSSLEGVTADISTYFEVHAIPHNGSFAWQDVTFHLVRTLHIMNGHHLAPSYGLFFNVDGMNCLITTDTRLSPDLNEYYQKADIIFQDCETLKNKSGVHAHYTELVNLDPAIKRKMWLYHYNPGPFPDAEKDGFLGFVKPGQMFELKK